MEVVVRVGLSERGGRTGRARLGFTLIELLVVVAVIGLLIGILLPSLSNARRSARTTVCGTNLRSVARGIATYVTEFEAYPASYSWVGQFNGGSLGAISEPSNGIVHWSYYLYKSDSSMPSDTSTGATSVGELGGIPGRAFLCPELGDERGGLPPTNTTADNMDAGTQNEVAGIIDFQAPRMAYTLNEAICPRNRFAPGMISGQVRVNHWVRPTQVDRASSTILATEWTNAPKAVMGPSISGSGDAAGFVMKSHWPVSGFKGTDPEPTRWYPPGGLLHGQYWRVGPSDILTEEPPPAENAPNQLSINMVGHNHGRGPYASRVTNFAFVDGHVEPEKVVDTVKMSNYQWGSSFWSLMPDGGPTLGP